MSIQQAELDRLIEEAGPLGCHMIIALLKLQRGQKLTEEDEKALKLGDHFRMLIKMINTLLSEESK